MIITSSWWDACLTLERKKAGKENGRRLYTLSLSTTGTGTIIHVCMGLWWAMMHILAGECIMGKPTTRKPASSSMENSCISREAHAWREALFSCVCAWHGVHVHVKLEWFTVEHGLHNITRQIVQKSRQLDDYIDWLTPACSPITYTTHVTKFWVTPSYCAFLLLLPGPECHIGVVGTVVVMPEGLT